MGMGKSLVVVSVQVMTLRVEKRNLKVEDRSTVHSMGVGVEMGVVVAEVMWMVSQIGSMLLIASLRQVSYCHRDFYQSSHR